MRTICEMILAAAMMLGGPCLVAASEFSVSRIFSDHMVLQRGRPVPVWGEAMPGTKVAVRFGEASVNAVADAKGEWCAMLPAMRARRKGDTLSVKAAGGAGEAVFKDVLVGDVWLCGGQSNMELGFQGALCAKEESAKAADYLNVRNVKIENCRAFHPVKGVRCGKWVACTPENLMKPKPLHGVSAVGYFFARMLNRVTGVPQGMLNDNWGGCRIEPFISLEGLKDVPQLKTLVEEVERADRSRTQGNRWVWNHRQECAIQYGKYLEECRAKKVEPEYLPNTRETMQGYEMDPSAMYNAMVAPLARFPIAGVLWYQGESNIGEENYPLKLKALADGWRKAWGYDVPFCIFQLSSIGEPDPDPAQNQARPRTRDDQRRASQEIPDCGFVVTTDVGATYEHPLNKRDVGERAARWALNRVYGKKDVVPSGPMFTGYDREGDKLRVKFDYVGGGLVAADKDPEKPGVKPVVNKTKIVKGFTIQGESGKWHTANAVIDGASVVVSAPSVKNPKNVRYAHMDNTMGLADLYNAEGLPAAAFRTDTGKAGKK